jgi:phage gp46-like protein
VDALLELDGNGGGDLVVANGDLVLDHTLRGEVLASLFCDARRPSPTAAGDPSSDPRGYWADVPADRWGSRLWEVARGDLSDQALADAADFARVSLKWMVDQGFAKAVEVQAFALNGDRLELDVTLTRPDPLRYQELWDEESVVEVGPVRLRVLSH